MKLETAQKIHEDCHGAPGDCSVCPLNTRPDYGHSYCSMVSMLRRAPEPVCPECIGPQKESDMKPEDAKRIPEDRTNLETLRAIYDAASAAKAAAEIALRLLGLLPRLLLGLLLGLLKGLLTRLLGILKGKN